MASFKQQIETVYAAMAFAERNQSDEARNFLASLKQPEARTEKRAQRTSAPTRRPDLRAE
jgi:hypothetical protein